MINRFFYVFVLGISALVFNPAALLAQNPGAQNTATVNTEHAKATLMVSRDRVRPGETVWAALKIELDPGWHTYWRNPGDSGLPATIEWSLPDGLTAGEIVWPEPERIAYGALMNFGYSDSVILPVPLTLSGAVNTAQRLNISANAHWLVCADICIPAEGTFLISFGVNASENSLPSRDAPEIDQALAAMPKAAPWPVNLKYDGSDLHIKTDIRIETPENISATFFPYDPGLIDNASPQRLAVNNGALSIIVAKSTAPLDIPHETGGLIVIRDNGNKKTYFFTTQSPAVSNSTPPSPAAFSQMNLWLAVISAFLGGIILNLMPCVLPVLAMKALALARQDSGSSARRRDGLVYTFGVLITFGILAGALIGLRGAGSEVGWGFQLQSPAFVTTIGYVFLTLGLSLSGVFTLGAGLMGAGQNLTQQKGTAGAFFTGALAVVVATPCTAPFMATAVGYALAQDAIVVLAIFESLALGLAAPFLLFSFIPKAATVLPRPGVWMDRLKQVLAFPMYGSAAWLVWVLAQQVNPAGLAAALAGFVLIGFSAWLLGLAQQSGRFGFSGVMAAMGVGLSLLLTSVIAQSQPSQVTPSSEIGVEIYSAQRLDELRKQNRAVFVNFTAAWCITCLMNERVALTTSEVKQTMAAQNVVYMKADWTRRDAEITKTLGGFGRSGVPLYVYYGPDGAAPLILPQILTPGIVKAAITPG